MLTRISLAAIAFTLAGCTAMDTPGSSSGSYRDPSAAAAERACLARANDFSNGAGVFVVSSEFSEANSLVIVEDRNGDRYRCLSSNRGEIAEFSIL